jgi:hypothetical protein
LSRRFRGDFTFREAGRPSQPASRQAGVIPCLTASVYSLYIYWKIAPTPPLEGNISQYHLGEKYEKGKRKKGDNMKGKRKKVERKRKKVGRKREN